VKPGDAISASIIESGGTFTYTLTNVTTGSSGAEVGPTPRTALNSGECVAMYQIGVFSGAPLPLAQFRTAKFGQDYTQVQGTCLARVSDLPITPVGSPPIGI
jgi:hypothetical protein